MVVSVKGWSLAAGWSPPIPACGHLRPLALTPARDVKYVDIMTEYGWQRTGISSVLSDLEHALSAATVRPYVSREALHAVYASSLNPEGELALTAEEIEAATTDLASAVAAARAMEAQDDWPVDAFRAYFRSVREFGAAVATRHNPALLVLGVRGAEQVEEFVELLLEACSSAGITAERTSTYIDLTRYHPLFSGYISLLKVASWQHRGITSQQAVDALVAAGFDAVIAGKMLLDGGAPALDAGLL